MTIYLSGPITGMPDLNKPYFAKVAQLLKDHGSHEVINPHEICSHLPEGTMWEDYMRTCIKAMMDCDVILLLDGWARSRGAVLEHGIARQVGLVVANRRDIIPDSMMEATHV